MTLDDQLLVEARAVRERLLDLQHEVERARADYQHSIRRLHAAGGSMREIAEVLGLSHQRVHQIVDAGPEDARPRGRRLGHRHGGRFTRAAREAVVVAQEEASALGHAYIGTEHLLLGLLRVESGGAASALASLGITYDGLRADVGTAAEAEPKQSRGRIPFTATAKKALQQAADEAASRRNRWVGTEHVLLGVSAVSDSLGAELLTAAGADQAKVREAVERALGR